MAVNLKEYVRESISQYLRVIKTKFYTKAEVDLLISGGSNSIDIVGSFKDISHNHLMENINRKRY